MVFNSLFVQEFGSKRYSTLVFHSLLISTALYFLFMSLGQRKTTILYATLIGGIWLAATGLWVSPQSAALIQPIAALFLVVDIIGINVVTASLQSRTSPIVFRKVYQKIMSFELVGRIAAAACLAYFGAKGQLRDSVPWILGALLVHLGILARCEQNASPIETATTEAPSFRSAMQQLRSCFAFLFSNPLVKVALVTLIWARIAKFLVDFVYYQMLAAKMVTADKIGAFESLLATAGILITLLFQFSLGRTLHSRFSISVLFGVLPAGILSLGAVLLFFPSFWPAVALLIFFQVVFRVIHFPTIRQCLLPVPRKLSHSLFSAVILISLASSILISGLVSSLKSHWGIPEFTLALLAASATLFFFLTDLDSFYVWNFWSYYRETREGDAEPFHWADQPTSGGLLHRGPLNYLPENEDVSAQPSSLDATGNLLQEYRLAGDSRSLKLLVRKHRALLSSKNPSEVIAGLSAAAAIRLPALRQTVESFVDHPTEAIRAHARILVETERTIASLPLQGHRLSGQRKIQRVLLEAVGNDRASRAGLERILGLKTSRAEAWLASLDSIRNNSLATQFLIQAADRSHDLSLQLWLDALLSRPFSETAHIRQALLCLRRSEDRKRVQARITEMVKVLEGRQFQLRAPDRGREAHEPSSLDLFLHTLFLEERSLPGGRESRRVLETIGELGLLQDPDLSILTALHLEFLKKSRYHNTWKRILSARPASSPSFTK